MKEEKVNKLSKDEIEVHKAVEADNQDVVSALRKHQEALRPKRRLIDMTQVNMTNAGYGINPQSRGEEKLLEACERDGLSFSEKKQRLDALRADLPKLNPAQVL